MTIRHLMIFRALCENGCNTTKAAGQLHMTQPAVSLAIKEMEEYYNTVFFDRLGRRLRLNDSGKTFLEYAIHILDTFNDLETFMKTADETSEIHIGASVTIGSRFLPYYIRTFKEIHPGARIHAQVTNSEELEQQILSGALDFALIEGVAHHDSLVVQPYMDDRIVIVASRDSKYAENPKLTVRELMENDFLLREPGSGTREIFDSITALAGFHVSPVWESSSTTALVNAVICGLGISVLPYRMISGYLDQGILISLQVEGLDLQRVFNVIYHKDKYLTSITKKLIDHCMNYEADYPYPPFTGLF